MRKLVLGAVILLTAWRDRVPRQHDLDFRSRSAGEPDGARWRSPPVDRAESIVIARRASPFPSPAVRPGQLADTYTQARAGGRAARRDRHHGAARHAGGRRGGRDRREALFSQGGGGITAYVRSPDRRWIYYYAHLDAYAPGLREGQRIRRGDPIGTVGSTGNANPAGPHLHFAIHRMAPGRALVAGQGDQSLPAPCRARRAPLKPRPTSPNPASIPMKISGVDIRPGNIIEYEGGIWRAVKIQHTQPGKGGAYMQVEMKNLIDGRKNNVRFRSAETVERVRLDTKDFQFLFRDGDALTFMDKDNYEQITLPADLLGDAAAFLQDGMDVVMELYNERPISVQLPDTIEATIVEADAVVKGQTASSSYKPAILDNGVRVMVPPHIGAGTRIVVDVYEQTYVRRRGLGE